MSSPAGSADDVDAVLAAALAELEVEHTRREPGQFLVTMAGTRRLQTVCWLVARERTVLVQAFVCRRPDADADRVHRFLLQRNTRLYGVHYAIDHVGDIHLVGRLPRHALTVEELDRILGQVLTTADGDFNILLELGFAGSIRREHAWRVDRGESTANLAAFAHLVD